MNDLTRLEFLSLKLIDGELTDEEQREFDALLDADPEAKAAHFALVEQEAALRGMVTVDLTAKIMARVRAYQPSEPDWRWLFSRRFWLVSAAAVAVAAAILLIVTVERVNRQPISQETVVFGQVDAAPGQTAPQRVQVRDGRTNAPIGDAQVLLALLDPDGSAVWNGTATTDDAGYTLFEPTVPGDAPEGSYTLRVEATRSGTTTTVERTLEIHRSNKVMLVTDKPTYQPGQSIHIRSLSRNSADDRPVADADLVLEVLDAKGNKVFKEALVTSKYGIAAADFQLADQVVTGEYTVRALLGDTESERSVVVEHYTLPKFAVNLTTHAGFYAPGAVVSGTVRSTYTFGKPVVGEVSIEASEFIAAWEPFATASGRTDAEGVFAFELPLKASFAGTQEGEATVRLQATVTDTAGHTQTTAHELVVATRPLNIEVFPESGQLVPGVPNTVYVLTSYPDGRPAETELEVDGLSEVIRTSAAGVSEVELVPSGDRNLRVVASDSRGIRAEVNVSVAYDERPLALLLHTDQSAYSVGDTAIIEILAPEGSGVAFVDVVREHHTVLTRTLQIRDGRAQLALDLPSNVNGTLEVHAYRLSPTGEVVGDTRVIEVDRADDLTITADLDRDVYRPGGRAHLSIAVSDEDGEPVPAALGMSVVDEAVFALQELSPGLSPQKVFAPAAEVYSVTPAAASERYGDRQARFAEERANYLETLAGKAVLVPTFLYLLLTLSLLFYCSFRGLHRVPVSEGPQREALVVDVQRLAILWTVWIYAPFIVLFLAVQARGSGVMVGIAVALFTAIAATSSVAQFRRNPASRAVPLFRKILVFVPISMVVGTAIPLVAWVADSFSHGPSEGIVAGVLLGIPGIAILGVGAVSAAGASLREISLGRWLWILATRTTLAGLPGFLLVMVIVSLIGGHSAATLTGINSAGSDGAFPEGEGATVTPTTRVRRHFPETLLWIPELITDDRGRASLDIELADSITDWRASLSAVSADGALGGTDEKIRVFQDFFVDIDFPVTLTQHDQVTVPVAVYNYLDVAQTVRLETESADWFSLSGPASKSLRVDAGEVTVATFTLTALTPGDHALLIRATGSSVADAVERTVRVEPDGQAVVQTFSGRVADGVSHEIVIPDDAIAGASDLFVKVYPGSFSQLVEGLDSVFRMPHGCFEQTSSTTYPNVLVLDYLRQTKQIKPEIELKALQYIGVGYQRLLSFEVSGGGFEWFGRSPANIVLTAYGLMEFSDMSRVYEVDPAVIARTRDWLYRQQERDGSWHPDAGGLSEGATNQFGGQVLRTTAYVAWALAESSPDGQRDYRLARALDYIAAHLGDTDDPYTLAVCANALVAADQPGATQVIERLDRLKTSADGLVLWSSSSEGVTYSRGDVLDIETTAIAAHAYLQGGLGTGTAHPALAWLTTRKDQFGNWHSTQATVHAFRALIKGAGSGSELDSDVALQIVSEGAVVETLNITPADADVFRLVDLRDRVALGKNHVALETSDGGSLAYQIVAKHYVPWPPPAEPASEPITIELDYEKTRLAVEDTLQVGVEIAWNRLGGANMTLVDLGIPPGFVPVEGTFEQLVADGVVEKFSVTGAQVILYIRRIEQGEPLRFGYDMRAKFPVRAQAPAATAYQYYEPDVRHQTAPVDLTVE